MVHLGLIAGVDRDAPPVVGGYPGGVQVQTRRRTGAPDGLEHGLRMDVLAAFQRDMNLLALFAVDHFDPRNLFAQAQGHPFLAHQVDKVVDDFFV